MVNFFRGSKLKAFGLDISDISIKVLELERTNGAFMPLGFSEVPLAAGTITNHMIMDEQKLADNIRKAVAAARKIDTKYTVVSVPESKSFVRVIKIFKMDESEIAGALPFELEQNIPVPVDSVYMDWQLIRATGDQLEILVTATPKDYVDMLVEALKMAGLKPIAFELESQAIARALLPKSEKNISALIVDISSIQTSFMIVDAGHVTYTSSIPVAGNAFTDSISRNLGIGTTDAEKIKREVGLMGDFKKGNIRQSILPQLDSIIDEIKNVIKFYSEHSTSNVAISKIILCGGSSKMPGLEDYVSARINLTSNKSLGQVELGNSWLNIADTSKKNFPIPAADSPAFATVAGLALRAYEGL